MLQPKCASQLRRCSIGVGNPNDDRALFVTILLVWVMIRYNAKANPNPSSVTHNTMPRVRIAIPTIVLVLLVFRLAFDFLH